MVKVESPGTVNGTGQAQFWGQILNSGWVNMKVDTKEDTYFERREARGGRANISRLSRVIIQNQNNEIVYLPLVMVSAIGIRWHPSGTIGMFSDAGTGTSDDIGTGSTPIPCRFMALLTTSCLCWSVVVEVVGDHYCLFWTVWVVSLVLLLLMLDWFRCRI